ncbi:MAG: acyltransferase [Cyanobacteria bacterium P01_D01_bin.36]
MKRVVNRNVKAQADKLVVNSIVLLTTVFILTVLLLHHGSYTHDYIWQLRQIEVNKYLQQMAVGGFLFLSGYKLMASKATTRIEAFWRNRLMRIYPPYLLALVAYSFTDYVYRQERLPSFGNFLLHAGLLQSVLPNLLGESYRTLWFVSLLFCCYGFFLLMRRLVSRVWLYLAVNMLVVAGINGIRGVFSSWGVTVFIESFEVFVLFFSCGMLAFAHRQKVSALICRNVRLYQAITMVTAVGLAAVKLFAIASGISKTPAFYYFDLVSIFLTTIPLYLLFLSGVVEVRLKKGLLTQLIQKISVASFFVYLFHRPIWSVLASVWTGSGFVHSLYIFVVGLPIIFAVSYWGQTAYTGMVNRQK